MTDDRRRVRLPAAPSLRSPFLLASSLLPFLLFAMAAAALHA